MNPTIKHRYTGKVLFEGEAGMTIREMLEKATIAKVDLRGAYLSNADLRGADLSNANLRGADLRGAYLSNADLIGAYLIGADLRGADLRGADLIGAYLSGADGKQLPRATPKQAIEILDKVREIVLDNAARFDMGHWHGDLSWRDKTCAEEVLCGTTHCLAGWLQVCTPEVALKDIDTQLAGVLAAPVAAKMFFRSNAEVSKWLKSRAYVDEIAESEKRKAERALAKGE
jgi:uncharacterized protein YjbI with pentapeptide repeats